MNISFENINSFFSKVKSLEEKLLSQRISTEQSDFNSLKARYNQEKPRFDELRKTEAPFYNLFEILNVHYLEESLHTPFLKHLLDPKASHEQGALYLNLFFSKVLGLNENYEQITNFSIQEEYVTNHGRIDLIVRYNFQNRLKLIIIENKIYANDQKNQLQRYYEFAKTKLESVGDLVLIYLTPNGTTPSSYSMSFEKQNYLREKNILKEISYKEHIITWLENSIDETCSDKVKQTIIQYLMTLYIL